MSTPPHDSAPTATTPGRSEHAGFRRALTRAAPVLRRDLPWLNDPRPWAVLVSEVMLQQTQTSRVIGPWEVFLERFPTPTSCADSPLSAVLTLWSGLGYPRRAKALHAASRMIRDEFSGEVPREVADLKRLPGVGNYTAHAVASFAFGEPVAVLDTNVGRVLARALANRSLRPLEASTLAAQLVPRRGSSAFNQSMLDLGAQFCRATPRCDACPVAKHCAWRNEGGEDPAPFSAGVSRAQSPFVGSSRQLRGRVLRVLGRGPCSVDELGAQVEDLGMRREEILQGLIDDGLVSRRGASIALADG